MTGYLSPRDTVLQSQMIHPDWSAQDHLDYLVNDAFFSEFEIDTEDPLATVTRWLREINNSQ
jgi:hypothetical protein